MELYSLVFNSIALLLLCGIASANGTDRGIDEQRCPRDWRVEQLLPHPNCQKFYQCSNGQLVAQTCPTELYFGIVENRCEWKSAVDCGNRIIPDENDNKGETSDGDKSSENGDGNWDPNEAPSICARKHSNGVLVAHEKCDNFYICDNGKPVALQCPDNLLFNPKTDKCDWKQNVDCRNRIIPGKDDDNEGDSNGDSDNGDDNNGDGDGDTDIDKSSDESSSVDDGNNENDPRTICAQAGSNGVRIAHELLCNQYYICRDGNPVLHRCLLLLLFNPVTQRCEWPWNVQCRNNL